jgi:hypothetical protein
MEIEWRGQPAQGRDQTWLLARKERKKERHRLKSIVEGKRKKEFDETDVIQSRFKEKKKGKWVEEK